MKKLKYLIMAVVAIVLVIIIILVIKFVGNKNKNQNSAEEKTYNPDNEAPRTYGTDDKTEDYIKRITTLRDVDTNQDFFIAMNCVDQYYSAINQSTWDLSNDQNNEVKNSYIQRVYNLLSKDYIDKNKITKENVMDHVEKVEGIQFLIPLKMKTITSEDEKTQKFSVYGIIEDENYNYVKDFYAIVIINNKVAENGEGYTISVEPQPDANYQRIDDIKLDNNTIEISENDDNKLDNIDLSDETITRDFTDYYKKLILGRPDIAYDLLNKDYREKRFGSLDKFKSFIEEDKQEIETLYMKQYQVNRSDGENENNSDITQYVGKDQYGRVYAFDMESPTNYTVQLDSYTLNTDYFKSQYDSGNSEKKVALDVYKFVLMINNQDWDTAYSLLDDGFKNNYFKTVDDFKNYVRECAYKYNEMEPTSFEQVGNIYTYGVQLTDLTEGAYEDETKGTGGSGYIFDWKFNVQLGNDYDYKISFEVN